MFYEMILFCSLAGVVGAIISLAEINTEKSTKFYRKEKGSPNCGSTTLPSSGTGSGKPKHPGLCSFSVPALASARPWAAGILPQHGASFLSVLYSPTTIRLACKRWV